MAFDFNLFKSLATDKTTLGFATAASVFDYYGQKSKYKKEKKYLEFQADVIESDAIAKENGIAFNTYLTNSVTKQQHEAKIANEREMAAQSISQGAEIGQEGSAAAIVARNAQFQVARAQAARDADIERNIAQAQAQTDDLALSTAHRIADLDYRKSNLESPSIISSVVNSVDLVYSALDSFEVKRQRAIAKEDKRVDRQTTGSSGTGTLIK